MAKVKWIVFIAIAAISTVLILAAAKPNKSVLELQSAIMSGNKLYQIHCAACHGQEKTGGMAQTLYDDVWTLARTEKTIKSLIKTGDSEAGMPSFEDRLTDKNIDDLYAYITSQVLEVHVKPATQAPQTSQEEFNIQIWMEGLNTPWSLIFTGMNNALLTEKSGNLYEIHDGVRAPIPILGTPVVKDKRQGGLMDVAVDPDFESNGWVYLSFSHPLDTNPDLAMTKIVRGRIKNGRWQDEQTIFEAKSEHYIKTSHHYGGRIVFDHEGHIFFSIGDRGQKQMAQDITRPNGKVHRLMRDGRVPKDNPFATNPEAYPSIFSYGHRNPQGLVFAGDVLWSTEHGPKGGDELNRIEAGLNYGWPVVSYGRNYSGTELTPYTYMKGMQSPESQWTPSIAACGLDVYAGDLFPQWNGFLLAGALKYKELRLITLKNGHYVSERILLKDKGRVRDVSVGKDGAIYVVLNKPGQILRLTPKTNSKALP